MLHAVIIITASGLILFQKEFALLPSSSSSLSSSPSLSQQSASYISLSSKSGQLAGIITAVINFSLSRLGGQVSYIQTDHVGVALAVHQQTKCTCAVFHQVADVRLAQSSTAMPLTLSGLDGCRGAHCRDGVVLVCGRAKSSAV